MSSLTLETLLQTLHEQNALRPLMKTAIKDYEIVFKNEPSPMNRPVEVDHNRKVIYAYCFKS